MENTLIQWCDATVNFWMGCKKVSDGCKFCYMFRDFARYNRNPEEVVQVQQKTVNKTLKELKKKHAARVAAGIKTPLKIFTCSWSDFFIEDADSMRNEAWNIIRSHPEFIWIILTKRIERAEACFPEDWGQGWSHVWLGVSVENDKPKNLERIDILAKTPSHCRVISAEPLLSSLPLIHYFEKYKFLIHWVIVGGESGNDTGLWKYRPIDTKSIQQVVHDCKKYKVAVFVKQLGTHLSKTMQLKDRHGGDLEEFPVYLQIRQFPGEPYSFKHQKQLTFDM